ncbi:ATP-binding cassette sub- A member 1 [Chytriomyces hyalinus]|nr:ATP-binding cassette sub- A member 1 [Chytriomyces hyalinus]
MRYSESIYSGIVREFTRMNTARCAGSSSPEIDQTVSDLSFRPHRPMGTVRIPNAQFLYDYSLQNPATTRLGVVFEASDTLLLNIEYTIWHNASAAFFKSGGESVFDDNVLRLMRGLDEAIVSYLNPDARIRPAFNANIRDWPKVFPEFASNVAQTSGPAFLVCTTILVFISSIHKITSEKESKLYAALRVSGIQPHTYAITHLISRVLIVAANSLVTVLAGTFAFQFRLFQNASFFALISSFCSFGVAMEAVALFIASGLETTEPAVLAGTAVFVVAILLQTFVFSDGYYGYILYNPTAASPVIWKVLTMFPFFNFGKLLLDLTTCTHGKRNPVTSGYVEGPGFTITSLVGSVPAELLPVYSHGTVPDPPAPILSLLLLWMNVALFTSAAIMLEMLKSGFSINRFSFAVFGSTKAEDSARTINDIERVDCAKPPCDSSDPVMSIRNLNKTFQSGNLIQRKSNAAVDGLDLDLYPGEIFALLGKSGVGKTTLTNILTRQLAPDSGSIAFHNDRRLHQSIGVCPQTDILFPDLTAREHLVLYSAFKGVTLLHNGDAALESINLTKSGDRLVREYSGGMKRRLSLLLSTLSAPSVLFLDEPTAGLDPCNRQHVWKLIQSIRTKTNCTIVLTTHSMDEVEALADRVGIMSAGKFCAMGTLQELKKRHGACGFRLSVDFGKATDQKEMVMADVHGLGIRVRVEEENNEGVVFRVVEKSEVARLVQYLEKQKHLIRGWSIAPVTLEDVFMELVGS